MKSTHILIFSLLLLGAAPLSQLPAQSIPGTAAQLIGNIETRLAATQHGSILPNPHDMQLPTSLNTWFQTRLFDKAKSVRSFHFLPGGELGQDRISISALQFSSDADAAAAVAHMDRHGLRRVPYFPPTNWFWIGFRDCVLFMACNGTKLVEEPYRSVIQTALMEIHALRVQGAAE